MVDFLKNVISILVEFFSILFIRSPKKILDNFIKN
jgi:hypothetical protein